MYLRNCTEQEVSKIVDRFIDEKSIDINGFSINIVNKVISNIINPLTYICIKSYQEGGFPDNVKISKVIPILKSGDNGIL